MIEETRLSDIAVEFCQVSKSFGSVMANDAVSLEVRRGEILALLGENGSGKTTLMNMLSGIYYPDSGSIRIGGEEVTIRNPADAYEHGVGMVHQHFKLVDVLTAAENVVIGLKGNPTINRKKLTSEIDQISKKFGFDINPNIKVYDMSVSERQTVEIIKVLYRGADILILDEPTAVLTPQEVEKLFKILRLMKNEGKSIIIITHKLNEVLAISDRVSILRKGKYICTMETADATRDSLTECMVGRPVSLSIHRSKSVPKRRLEISQLSCVNSENVRTLDNVSFTLYGGDILGVAGITGCGQKELCEAIAGLLPVREGQITYYDDEQNPVDITDCRPQDLWKKGVKLGFVPEDRLGMGLVARLDLVENMMLKTYKEKSGFFADRKRPKNEATTIVEQLDIVTPDVNTPVRNLSGGNVQKVLLGRELLFKPKILIVSYPVRGLDIHSSFGIYDLLNKQKEQGVAILFVGEDLDVLTQLCDRILVLCDGKVSALEQASETTINQIGLRMTCLQETEHNEVPPCQ